MKTALLGALASLACSLAAGGESTAPAKLPYKDDPKVITTIKSLKPGQIVKLPTFNILPKDAAKYHYTFKNGPYARDYGNKIPYAPDRQTGMYCGANHGVPHRMNDVWEYHLGSNTWHLICPPGGDWTYWRKLGSHVAKLRKLEKQGKLKDPQKLADAIKKSDAYWLKHAEMKDGYVQDKANGGPIQPWHTWDGITYNQKTKQLYWNVLDTQNFKDPKHRNNTHVNFVRAYAKRTGQDAEALLKKLKPASSMYAYSQKTKRWKRQQGKGPFPLMRGMGSTIHYIPDIDKTLFYCCVGNTPGGSTEGMWSYDANTNLWKQLIPGGTVRNLVHNKKIAPGEELQVAYSVKDKKLVAVQKHGVFIYDVPANKWSRGKDTEAFAHDAKSTFVYDSNADVFLLLARKGKSVWAQVPLAMYAYTLSKDSWEKIELPLLDDSKGAKWRRYSNKYAGYYDPHHNVLVLYRGRNVWIYRHKKAAPAGK
jgi:hypothetical protein